MLMYKWGPQPDFSTSWLGNMFRRYLKKEMRTTLREEAVGAVDLKPATGAQNSEGDVGGAGTDG